MGACYTAQIVPSLERMCQNEMQRKKTEKSFEVICGEGMGPDEMNILGDQLQSWAIQCCDSGVVHFHIHFSQGDVDLDVENGQITVPKKLAKG